MPIILLAAWLAAASPAAPAVPPDTAAASPAAPAVSPDTAAVDSLPFRLRPLAVVVPQGNGKGHALEPSGVAVDAFGRLVVADAALNRLQRFEPNGTRLEESGALGSEPGLLRRPGAVALLGTLGIVVLDRENRRVERYDLFLRRQGTLIDLQDPALADRLGHIQPLAMAADRGGALYVADGDGERILAFDFGGQYLRTLGGFGPRAGSFRGLAGIAATPHGELVTAERTNARVQRLGPDGRSIAAWPFPAVRTAGALAVAVDDSSRVAVADESAGRVWLFDGGGRTLALLSGLSRPASLAFAPDGTLLIAESARGEVRRFAVERVTRVPRGD
jgi:sugar lactone lactonase YvrE